MEVHGGIIRIIHKYMGASPIHGGIIHTWGHHPYMGTSSIHGDIIHTWGHHPYMGTSSIHGGIIHTWRYMGASSVSSINTWASSIHGGIIHTWGHHPYMGASSIHTWGYHNHIWNVGCHAMWLAFVFDDYIHHQNYHVILDNPIGKEIWLYILGTTHLGYLCAMTELVLASGEVCMDVNHNRVTVTGALSRSSSTHSKFHFSVT